MGVLKYIRKWLDKYPSERGGLMKGGKWHVLYPDGRYSIPMKYDDAKNYAEIFGGIIIHISDRKPKGGGL
jgi:hypothetical protein